MDENNTIERANKLFNTGKYDEAKKLYKSITDIIINRDAVHTYGLCLVRLEKYDEAIELFTRIVEVYGDFGEVWYSLGRTYLIIENTEKGN